MVRDMSLRNRDAEQVTAGPRSTPAATAEGGQTKERCHSPKRTHRFFDGKLHLTISDTMGYAIEFHRKSVGSFSKTNPPERGFRGFRGDLLTELGPDLDRFCGNGRGHDGAWPSKADRAIWIAGERDLGYKCFPARGTCGSWKDRDFR